MKPVKNDPILQFYETISSYYIKEDVIFSGEIGSTFVYKGIFKRIKDGVIMINHNDVCWTGRYNKLMFPTIKNVYLQKSDLSENFLPHDKNI